MPQFEEFTTGTTKPLLVSLISAMAWNRTPGIFKVAANYGDVVERAPPYRPEVQPAEFDWARLNVGYGPRYGSVGVLGYIETFCDGIGEADLS